MAINLLGVIKGSISLITAYSRLYAEAHVAQYSAMDMAGASGKTEFQGDAEALQSHQKYVQRMKRHCFRT